MFQVVLSNKDHMYLEDGRIVIEILEDLEEELLEEAWDEAQEDDVLSQLPTGLLTMFRCMGISPEVVRDVILEGGYVMFLPVKAGEFPDRTDSCQKL